jgi:hypothetical protein
MDPGVTFETYRKGGLMRKMSMMHTKRFSGDAKERSSGQKLLGRVKSGREINQDLRLKAEGVVGNLESRWTPPISIGGGTCQQANSEHNTYYHYEA